uniref:Histone-lysine N-methyltransferase SETDB2 n=1 Tax=Acanthochromis polyacanthus TaxID=80966 RepID=A0A3Q1FGT1_9TELE
MSISARAKTFWAEEDVDQAFDGFFVYLDHLKRVLKAHTATDKGLGSSSTSPADQDSSVVQVVIGSGRTSLKVQQPRVSLGFTVFSSTDELLPAQFSHNSPASDGTQSSAAPPAGQDELLPPLLPEQLQYQLHTCCKTCLPSLPSMPQSTPPFWGQNPLKVPLLCGFKRLSAVPLSSPGGGGASEDEGDQYDWDVIYKAPCGQSLRNYDDVMRFLLATESYDVLQMDFFTFSAAVRLDPPPMAGPRRPEQDLSRGAEPTPVELCVGDGGVRPTEFRYRKDRWPHGCFLSRGPALFHDCCDCLDGCNDASSCACIAMTTGGPVIGSCVSGDQNQKVSMTTLLQVRTTTNIQKDLKRTMDDVCLIDASREGNVGRFINHSCQPNLFVQNVFTDSHDPSFPVVAFFTSRAVVAGTELTWDYGSDSPASSPWQQEAVCLCGADGCRQRFTIQEKLCDVCDAQTEAQ